MPYDEIASEANDFNLNIPRYIDSSEPEDIQDLDAHLHGGIPERDVDALQPFWDAFPSLRHQLFTESRPGYSDLAVNIADVQQTVLDSSEFKDLQADVRAKVDEWFAAHRAALEAIGPETKPNDLIAAMGDDLLARFRDVPLLDPYDVYEQLLSYWDETMHDDVFLVMTSGWADAAKPRHAIVDKDKKLNETADLQIGTGKSASKFKMDLIPPAVITRHYFADELAALDELSAAAEAAAQAVEEYVEEHAVEEGLLWEALDDDKVTKASAKARLKVAKKEAGSEAEVGALEHVITLFDAKSAAEKSAKEAQAALDVAVLKKYRDLSEAEVQQLVLDGKWLQTIRGRIGNEVAAFTGDLVERIEELGERYCSPLPSLEEELERLGVRVGEHLSAMGVSA